MSTTIHRRSRRASGFTLIELMVTIAIVAILAASCVPIMKIFAKRGRISTAVTAGRCILDSFAAAASTSGVYPIVADHLSLVQTATANGCPMPFPGSGMTSPVYFGGYFCYEQDPITGTIFIRICDPVEFLDYRLELGITGVPDTKVVVDSRAEVFTEPLATPFPLPPL